MYIYIYYIYIHIIYIYIYIYIIKGCILNIVYPVMTDFSFNLWTP